MPIGISKTPGARTWPLTPTNFDPAAPFTPCALYQSGAAREDRRGKRERLDVVDDRRLLPQPLQRRKRRLVARLGALAFDRLEQRALLAADVAARADEHLEVELAARAENALAEHARA